MLFNYLKTAYRNIVKTPLFSFINIGGLALGMALFLLIFQYVRFELNYDTFHKDHENIVRLSYSKLKDGKRAFNSVLTYSGVPARMKEEFPEIIDYVRIAPTFNESLINYKDIYFKEDGIVFADSTLFTIFSFDLIQGDPKKVLNEPFTAVISESIAEKYFGNEDPIGKSFRRGMDQDYTVTGVVKDIPKNSHIKFDFILSHSTMRTLMGVDRAENDFRMYHSYAYFKLLPETNLDNLRSKFQGFVDKYVGGEELRKINTILEFEVQKIGDIHLNSHKDNEAETNGNSRTVYFFMLIAVIILVIALVNYINLSTSRSLERAREVGMRKVIGGQRSQLIFQFITESALVNILAVLIAGVIIALVRPVYNQLTGIPTSLSFFNDQIFIIGSIILLAVSIFLSGLYPAFVLSSFKPLSVIKGKFSNSKSGVFLRKALVVGQFAALLAIMTGTFTVYKQIQFMQNQDLNVDISKTLVLKAPVSVDSTYVNQLESFKEDVESYDAVKSMTASALVPGSKWLGQTWFKKYGASDDEYQFCYINQIDYDYLDSYGLKLLAGRNFSRDYSTDNEACILNETAVKQFGLKDPETAVSERMETFYAENGSPIIGVIADYHQESLKNETKPVIFMLSPSLSYYSLKINEEDTEQLIAFLQDKWRAYFGNNPMEYFFLEDFFDEQYKEDRQFGKLFNISSVFAIVISYLGLLGLTLYTVLQRRKEIGIRKVLGATTKSILGIFTMDFMKLIFISIVIAIPLSYFLINNWLMNYANRIEIEWWFFALPALIMMVFATLVINFQIIKSARTNPALILRCE
ncbi:MAG: ABC transporter permease [Bacteroidetes bacterium]|nr:ABC transporter permease [Bacteroidota bacterium]